jgi:hypothetical protein
VKRSTSWQYKTSNIINSTKILIKTDVLRLLGGSSGINQKAIAY